MPINSRKYSGDDHNSTSSGERTRSVFFMIVSGNLIRSSSRKNAPPLAAAGRVDLRLAAWPRAASLSKDARDWERLGLAWAIVGRNDDALQSLAEAVRIDPSTASTHLNYAVTLAQAGRMAEALAEAQAALQIEPNYENAKRLIEEIRKK